MDALSRDDDKTGEALSAQRFQMLEDIAKELSGDLVFPTHFDVTLRLRDVLKDPNVSVQQIHAAISVEPLVCSKLVSISNSAAYSRGGPPVRDARSAIQRLGVDVVRATAIGLAMKQLLLSKRVVGFNELLQRLWEHSFHTASACSILAGRLTRINPDEAMLAGLVHDLGATYMLYRASQYEELCARPGTVKHLVVQWHESIGESLLAALGMPEEIVLAVHDHDQPRPVPSSPRNLADIVFVGNLMAGGSFEWFLKDADPAAVQADLGEPYVGLADEARAFGAELRASFA